MGMNPTVLAALIQEGSRALTEFLNSRPMASRSNAELMSIQVKRQQVEDTYTQSLLAGPPLEPLGLDGIDKQIVSKSAIVAIQPKRVRLVKSEPREVLEGDILGPEDEIDLSKNDSEISTKAQSIAVGCVPCALGHIGTCSGLLNEAVRFSDNGMDDAEVIDRLNGCLDELNTMERLDLRPEKIITLPEWERKIAEDALKASRAARHKIEACRTKADLVAVAANTQTVRKEIGKEWFQTKIRTFKPDEKAEIAQKVKDRLSGDPNFTKEDQEEIARRVLERLEHLDINQLEPSQPSQPSQVEA